MAQRRRKNAAQSADPRQHLASVSAVLEHDAIRLQVEQRSHDVVVDAIQQVLDAYRAQLTPESQAPDLDTLAAEVVGALDESELDAIRPVVNATGIILHTGLGRAVLPQDAVDALAGVNRCCNLQIDLETGLRGKRNHVTEQLLCRLTGAEAALVVNNNAGATLLLLSALCSGKEVVVSRGQLIEIGGSYRLPDCIHASGAQLVEVGTTNKTHLRDYRAAATPETGALMRVNPSNYRIVGFSQDVPTRDLVTLKQELTEDPEHADLIVIDDLGCGALVNLEEYGLPHEPTVPDSVAAGADLVCFSGDKLIGGPQAGIIVGRKDLVDRVRKHPLTRMLRVGKLTDMVLEHTLRLFLHPERLREANPTIRMITLPVDGLKKRANALKRKLDRLDAPLTVGIAEDASAVGGGSLPGTPIPTFVVSVRADGMTADELSAALRRHEPPVIARIKDDDVLLDMRTLMDGDDQAVVAAFECLSGE